MIDPTTVQQAAPSFINWSINVYDLLLVGACAALLYGRLVTIEAQIKPIVTWWNQMMMAEHQLGRRWTDAAPPTGKQV